MDDITLKKLKKTEFDILCFIDDICKKHNIKYSLYAGTALGAVRHHGFIPWDDDIDIVMTREDLNRFLEIWKLDKPKEYYYETCLTDRNCGICHTKVRKNSTIYLADGEMESVGHHGIWVDIFPLDKIKPGIDTFKVYAYGLLLNMLTRANVNISNDSKGKKVIRSILQFMPYSVRLKLIHHVWQWFTQNSKQITDNYSWMTSSALYEFSFRFPQDIVKNYVKITFEGREFWIYKNYDLMLQIIYGDYMKFPPKEEQICTHKPIKIRF